jgi:hypothetical protein
MRKPRWIVWWRRNPAPAGPECRYCQLPLSVCSRCDGDWAATGCSDCGLGYSCTTHRSFWF